MKSFFWFPARKRATKKRKNSMHELPRRPFKIIPQFFFQRELFTSRLSTLGYLDIFSDFSFEAGDADRPWVGKLTRHAWRSIIGYIDVSPSRPHTRHGYCLNRSLYYTRWCSLVISDKGWSTNSDPSSVAILYPHFSDVNLTWNYERWKPTPGYLIPIH